MKSKGKYFLKKAIFEEIKFRKKHMVAFVCKKHEQLDLLYSLAECQGLFSNFTIFCDLFCILLPILQFIDFLKEEKVAVRLTPSSLLTLVMFYKQRL